MKGAGSKNAWALFLLILAGVVLGVFIGTLLWTILWNRRADRPGPGSVSHNIWSVDKDNHGKYHWRDSFHYHISFLIVYRKVGP